MKLHILIKTERVEETFESGTRFSMDLVEETVENFADDVEGVGKLADDIDTTKPKIWDDINKTADNMNRTEIPATFQIKVEGNFNYSNPTTNTDVLWVNANATKHKSTWEGFKVVFKE